MAPILHRRFPRVSGVLLAFIPFMIFVGVLSGTITGSLGDGAPSLLYLDGLSRLFVLLISGIGTLILLYTHGYLKGDPLQGRFMLYMMAFMGSMLGLAMSNHLLLLFIFWELTSFTSYLLIGYNHESQAARDAALQAMLVTVSGGLALMAGIILMTDAAGTWYLSELVHCGELLRAHEQYIPILVLVALGAFTKSAQFPFHFWLPGAMQAPTPASAYLHSSTMVKAGVYLSCGSLSCVGSYAGVERVIDDGGRDYVCRGCSDGRRAAYPEAPFGIYDRIGVGCDGDADRDRYEIYH